MPVLHVLPSVIIKMFKTLSVTLLLALSFQENFATVLPNDKVSSLLHNSAIPVSIPDISSKWGEHLKDFVELIDVDKVIAVAMGYLTDPEVLNFVTFLFSDEFKRVVLEFESIAEFKEAFKFLADKGYNVDSVIDFINNALELPPFEKPKVKFTKTGKGMTGLIEDIIAVLPMEEFKELFESKLETSPEVAELFETINSPEFMDIMKRMAKNPKFEEFKKIFEGFGFDFKYLCAMAKEIFGEYYQGLFCE